MPQLVQVVEINNNSFEIISHYPNKTISSVIDGQTFDTLIPTLVSAQVPVEYPAPLVLC
jgi:hypothetical protein